MKTKLNKKVQEFIESGFRKHSPNSFNVHAYCHLQKDIRDDNGKLKFYINVYPYITEQIQKVSLTCEMQGYSGDLTFEFTIHEVKSPQQAIDLCSEFWTRLNLDYDPHND